MIYGYLLSTGKSVFSILLFKLLNLPATKPMSRLVAFNPVLSKLQIGHSPLLIIGEGRSGTTWIGETFGRSPQVLYYVEPCNPDNNVHGTLTAWTRYVRPNGNDPYYERYLTAAFNGLISPGQTWSRQKFWRRLLPGYRVVIKEVATFMSLEWVYQRFDPSVLVVLRHPCGVALSNRDRNAHREEQQRLSLLKQNSELVDTHLSPYLSVIEKARTPLEVSSVIWAIRNRVLANTYRQYPWRVVCYEDLCCDPKKTFRSLFDTFDLPWDLSVERFIEYKTNRSEPGTFSTGRITQQQIDKWKRQLTPAEVEQVRRVVAPFELPFYQSEVAWCL